MKVDQIVRRIKIIEDLAEELNKIKALYEESLDNDDTFQEIEEHAKALRDESKEKKQQVLDKPEIKEFMQQIKEIRQDMKENSEVLSQELADYYKESGNKDKAIGYYQKALDTHPERAEETKNMISGLQ